MREGKAGKAGSAQEKLRHLAHPAGGAAGAKPRQLTFEIFFPRPGDTGTPYRGAHYRAARGKDGLFNFVGLVLGHGGSTVQRIQRLSGAKVEVRDSAGNLNGAHPSSHGDPSLHAWVAASSRQRLEKAVHLLLEVLAPTNTTLQPVVVLPGACAVLEPVVPGNGPEAAKQAAAERGHGPAGKAAGGKASTPPPPAVNAWASNRLLQQHGKDQQSAPPASPPTSPAAQQSDPAEQVFDRTDSDLSSAASGAGIDDDTAAAAVDPCKGFGGGLQSPASVVPPPPPPRHHQQEPQSPKLSASAPSAAPAAEPAPTRAADTTGAATALAAQAGQAAPAVPMATVWAKGLHPQEGPLETPATPSAAAERANPLAPERTATASSAGSWSLWDAGRSSTGSSFYEELQAAALGLGPQPATSQPSLLAPAAQRQLLHSNSWPQSHSQAERASQAALVRHNEALGLLPPPPHALASMAVPDQLAAPFPGLGRSASGLAQPLGSYSTPMLHSVVGAHSGVAGLAAGQPAGLPVVPPPSAGAHPYLGLAATAPLADLPSAAERELQQLLVALASMAALERGSL